MPTGPSTARLGGCQSGTNGSLVGAVGVPAPQAHDQTARQKMGSVRRPMPRGRIRPGKAWCWRTRRPSACSGRCHRPSLLGFLGAGRLLEQRNPKRRVSRSVCGPTWRTGRSVFPARSRIRPAREHHCAVAPRLERVRNERGRDEQHHPEHGREATGTHASSRPGSFSPHNTDSQGAVQDRGQRPPPGGRRARTPTGQSRAH
jgi:hypothetical protein